MTGIVEQIALPALITQEERFAALMERQSRFVFRVAYSILRRVADADDVVQETFLRVFRARRWEQIEDERAFLARIAWRVAVDRLAKRKTEAPSPATASAEDDPEQAAIAADQTARVQRLIDALPEELRQPLALSTVEEMTSTEIGRVMGIPEGTVRSRISRARQLLKEKLRGAHGK